MIDHHPLGQGLLGAHVAEGTDHVARHRQTGVGLQPGQAEVGDPEPALGVQKQIGRLDLAVDDADFVGVVERFGGLDAEVGHVAIVGAVAG